MDLAMNIENTKDSLEKITLYKKEEDIIFENMKSTMPNFREAYKTDNTAALGELEEEFKKKIKVLTKLHIDNIDVINKNIIGYIDTSKETLRTLQGIKIDLGD